MTDLSALIILVVLVVVLVAWKLSEMIDAWIKQRPDRAAFWALLAAIDCAALIGIVTHP